MQERLNIGNVKLLHVEGGLPHVHYFPRQGDEPSLIKDENEHVKKSYMRRMLFSKISILVVLLLILALASYLAFEITRKEDVDIEKITVTDRLLTYNNADPLEHQPIAYNHLDTNPLLSEELVENLRAVVTETQGDDSMNDSISQDYDRAPTEDEATEIAKEIHSDIHRLEGPGAELDLSMLRPVDSADVIILLIKAHEIAQASQKIAGSKIAEESNSDSKIWEPEPDKTPDTYSEMYDDDMSFNIREWFDHDGALENIE